MWLLDRKAKISAVRGFAGQQAQQMLALPEDLFRIKVSAKDTLPAVRSPADLTKLFRRIATEPRLVVVTDDTDAGAWTATTVGHLLRESGYQGELAWCPQFCVGTVESVAALSRWRAAAHERQQALLSITRGITRKLSGALYGGQYDVSALGIFYLACLMTIAKTGVTEARVSTPFGPSVVTLTEPEAEVARAVLLDRTEVGLTSPPIDTIDLIGWMSNSYGTAPIETLRQVQDLHDRGLVSCPFTAGGGIRPDIATMLHQRVVGMFPQDAAEGPQYLDPRGRALTISAQQRQQRLPPVGAQVLAAIAGAGTAAQMSPNQRAVVRYRLLGPEQQEVGLLELRAATTVGPDRILANSLSCATVQDPPPEIPVLVERRYGRHIRYERLLRRIDFVSDLRVLLEEMTSLVRQGLVADTGAGWSLTATGLVVLRDILRHVPEFLDIHTAPRLFQRAASVRTGRIDPNWLPELTRWARLRVRNPTPSSLGLCRCGGTVEARRLDHSMEGHCLLCSLPHRILLDGMKIRIEAQRDL